IAMSSRSVDLTERNNDNGRLRGAQLRFRTPGYRRSVAMRTDVPVTGASVRERSSGASRSDARLPLDPLDSLVRITEVTHPLLAHPLELRLALRREVLGFFARHAIVRNTEDERIDGLRTAE